MTSPLLTENEAAERLNFSIRTLQKWRHNGQGPAYIKLGDGPKAPVRYRIQDLDAFMEKYRVEPEQEKGRAA